LFVPAFTKSKKQLFPSKPGLHSPCCFSVITPLPVPAPLSPLPSAGELLAYSNLVGSLNLRTLKPVALNVVQPLLIKS